MRGCGRCCVRRPWRHDDRRNRVTKRLSKSPVLRVAAQGTTCILIGQAIALDFQAVRLQPKLVEMEFPRVRELYRNRAIHGGLFPTRHAARALEIARNVHKVQDSLGHWYEHPVIEERLHALTTTVDIAERTRLLQEIGDHKVEEFAEIPLFWLYAEAVLNPKYIAEYTFPGIVTGFFTHLEYIKPAP